LVGVLPHEVMTSSTQAQQVAQEIADRVVGTRVEMAAMEVPPLPVRAFLAATNAPPVVHLPDEVADYGVPWRPFQHRTTHPGTDTLTKACGESFRYLLRA